MNLHRSDSETEVPQSPGNKDSRPSASLWKAPQGQHLAFSCPKLPKQKHSPCSLKWQEGRLGLGRCRALGFLSRSSLSPGWFQIEAWGLPGVELEPGDLMKKTKPSGLSCCPVQPPESHRTPASAPDSADKEVEPTHLLLHRHLCL